MYLIISEVDGYIKEKNGSKYLGFDSVDGNNEVLKKHNELWDGIENKIETINGGKTSKRRSAKYDKYFMKIKCNSDDNLPINKKLKLHNMTIVIRSVSEEHRNFILKFV